MSTSSLTASVSESFVIPDTAPSENDEVDSLPSISSSVLDSEEDYSDAQREWEESLEQLQLLLTMIIMPFAGKYFGRKFAYWSWARYMEWMHNVEIRWTSPASFKAAGAIQAASTL
ncbi:hypothetical protein N656DRAFT_782979 [Canariomyces notabilis]|uniref:Uncharacterized protein n=1 Tax=Canariomyces notabilis TaxID=2074819 RepID=A0AAN6QMN5_9PEZI|nr:hypothetical protein N656DRAFT_782979 [Canariomyces arenarius]